MKLKALLVALFTTSILIAQEPKTNPPVIVAKIPLGKTVLFEDASIAFKSVVEDSRCPSDVNCIWAGQAKVLVAIKSNGTSSEKELIFHGTQFGSESENTLLVSETKRYIGYRLSPYPVSTEPTGKREYKLEVYIK